VTQKSVKGPSREQKADATTVAALEIIGREQASTAAKTERLRALRLAQAAQQPAEPVKATKARKSKASS
jgi:hypothetical protein